MVTQFKVNDRTSGTLFFTATLTSAIAIKNSAYKINIKKIRKPSAPEMASTR